MEQTQRPQENHGAIVQTGRSDSVARNPRVHSFGQPVGLCSEVCAAQRPRVASRLWLSHLSACGFEVAQGGQLVYRGRIDDWYVDIAKRRPAPTRRYLRQALDEVLKGQPVEIDQVPPLGCSIAP